MQNKRPEQESIAACRQTEHFLRPVPRSVFCWDDAETVRPRDQTQRAVRGTTFIKVQPNGEKTLKHEQGWLDEELPLLLGPRAPVGVDYPSGDRN